MYIRNYYGKLYNEEPIDENQQKYFLNLVQNRLDNQDIDRLGNEITEQEIHTAIKDLNKNKAPGIDGIPIEFYQTFWQVIKFELINVIKNISTGTFLKNNQRQAIITLIPKGGDQSLLKNWRPVSLICCDVKVVSKILANRLKPLMPNILSTNQYCISGKTITDCNTQIRDTLFYYGKKKSTGALINLDWEKAFDRVKWSFLMNVMKRMGFPEFILKWVLTLHTNLQSVCMINGYLTQPFDIKRGVRQGCPMSMLFFVIFQEPLYRAIEMSNKIYPPLLPSKQIKNLGYADDTTVFINNDEGFVEVFYLISKFQRASNAKLNISKTKVYGFGSWSDRTNWPIAGLQTQHGHFKTLGITFSCNYNTALNLNWERTVNKIKNRIPLIRNNFYTVYQKSAIVNCLLLSKLWYIAHVYPLPVKYSNEINTAICSFIWKPRYNPISKDVMYNSKLKGGIALIDNFLKARSIFTATVIKSFIKSDENNIIRCFMAKSFNILFGIRNNTIVLDRICNNSTPYYEYSKDLIQQCTSIKNFPRICSKDIYSVIQKYTKPNVENMYPNFEWDLIWKNLNFKYINIFDRHIMYKLLHEILTTNYRLSVIGRRVSPLCDTCNICETNIHMFLYCAKVQDSLSLLYKLIFYVCDLNINESFLRYIFLYFPKVNKKVRNTLCVIVSSYLSCIWINRECQDDLIYKFKAKMIKEQRYHLLTLGNKAKKIFTDNYCNLDSHIVRNL